MNQLFLKTTLLLCMVIILNVCKSQVRSVAGIVHDSINNQPLPNASVNVKELMNGGFNKITISDQNGLFSFTVSNDGFYRIEVNYSGYKSQILDSIKIDNSNIIIPTFYLQLEQKKLATVTVSTKKPFLSMGANKITLNVSESPIASSGNMFDIIKKAPGITQQGDNLSFRGKTIRFLINGRPSNLSGEELKNMLTNMPATTIEKVEILPNPSSKYDAQGGSVVNIILAKNKNYGTNFILTAGAGTGKYFKGNGGLDVNFRNKNINIYGGYNYSHRQQYYENNSTRVLSAATIVSKEYEERDRDSHTYKAGIDYDINKNSSMGILVNGFIDSRDKKANNTSVLHYFTNRFDSSSDVFTKGKVRFNRYSVNGYYKTRFDSVGRELTINADYMNYSKKWNDNFTNVYHDNQGKEYSKRDFIRDNSPSEINVYSLSSDYVHPGLKGKWEMGLKSTYTTTDNNMIWENNNGTGWITDQGKTNQFIYKENVNAAYINYSTTLHKWELQTGLRAEQTNTIGRSITLSRATEKHYLDFFPNASVQFSMDANNIFSLTYRRSIRRYDFNIVNPFIIYENQYFYSQGNPDLNPEKTHSLSLSYMHGENYSAGIDFVYSTKFLSTVFRNAPNNVLIQTYNNSSNGLSIMPYINIAKEAGMWSSNLYVSGGYINFILTNEAKVKTSNKTWSYIASIDNSFAFKKSWTLELSASYIGAITYGIYYYKPNYSADFGVAKQIWKNKGSIKLSISDILNSEKSDYKIKTSDLALYGNNKAESRFINLSFRYKFGKSSVKASNSRRSKLGDIQNRIN